MEVTAWLQIMLICFLGAISPGPSLALVVGNTINRGRIYGVAISLGHASGIGWWAFLTAIGVGEMIVESPGLLVGIKSLGACLIGYIGFRTLITGIYLPVRQPEPQSIPPRLPIRGTVEGFLIALLNPKVALFFLAIFSHFVRSDSGWIQTGLMGITAGLIDACWYVAIALTLTGTGMIRILQNGKGATTKITGGTLILISIYLLGTMVRDFF